METKDVRFKILINNSETQLIKNFFYVTACAYSFKKYTCFKEHFFSLKLFRIFSFKIENITQDPDPDPN